MTERRYFRHKVTGEVRSERRQHVKAVRRELGLSGRQWKKARRQLRKSGDL